MYISSIELYICISVRIHGFGVHFLSCFISETILIHVICGPFVSHFFFLADVYKIR